MFRSAAPSLATRAVEDLDETAAARLPRLSSAACCLISNPT